MSHRDFTRRLCTDVLAIAALFVLYLLAARAFALIAPNLPGGAVIWAAISVALMLAAAVVGWAVCRMAARVDVLLAEGDDQPDIAHAAELVAVLDAIAVLGERAEVVDFDFPQTRPQLVVIRGGRDFGGAS